MRTIACLLVLASTAAAIWAQTGSTINFNLVQVNHYNGDQAVQDSVVTPGQRIVIDLNSPDAYKKLLRESPAGQLNVAPVVVSVSSVASAPTAGAISLPWGTETILRAPAGADSFKVTSSRAGCPGTEVKPSVSVAFSTPHGWSDPPIRFGPLASSTICPLGKGYVLDVSVNGDSPPRVGIRQQSEHYTQR